MGSLCVVANSYFNDQNIITVWKSILHNILNIYEIQILMQAITGEL